MHVEYRHGGHRPAVLEVAAGEARDGGDEIGVVAGHPIRHESPVRVSADEDAGGIDIEEALYLLDQPSQVRGVLREGSRTSSPTPTPGSTGTIRGREEDPEFFGERSELEDVLSEGPVAIRRTSVERQEERRRVAARYWKLLTNSHGRWTRAEPLCGLWPPMLSVRPSER